MLPMVRMDLPLDTFGTHRNTHCNRYTVFRALNTCPAYRRGHRSIQMMRYMVGYPREAYSKVRTLLFLNRPSWECTDKIPSRMPGISNRYTPEDDAHNVNSSL